MKRLAGYGLAGAAVFVIVGAGALAGVDGRHSGGMFQRLDLNKDGVIAPSEAKSEQAKRFMRLDTDGDGMFTEEEMLEAAQARVARRIAKKFARLDRNGDGRVERAEFEERGAERFARLDADGDGLVSREEIRALRQGRRHGKHEDGSPND